ncbi:MAG: 50S ribosomal protein L22 [Deltaproteobacteria bacterium RIFCSPHIGHO2_02_FULL_40_11]|nr:MAG: 50S ribosomal protein L22 [Deltaproteobacteria bacterium RIFCSPHIGHO2_02_FULL_40_11]
MAGSRAHLGYVFIGPQKMGLVADLVRGKRAHDALNTLKFVNKRGAKILSKTIQSAIANADQKGNVDLENLYVKTVKVNAGMMHYRVRPRARGSAAYIRKKTSHLTVELEEK